MGSEIGIKLRKDDEIKPW